MSEANRLEQGGKSATTLWGVSDSIENNELPQRVTVSALAGSKTGLDVAVAGVVALTATFTDFATGWAAPNAQVVPAIPAAALTILPTANQVSVRLVPKDGRTYYYHFSPAFTEANSESFDQNSPVEIQTSTTVYVSTATGGGDGSIAIYQAQRA